MLESISEVVIETEIGFTFTPRMDVQALIWLVRMTTGNLLEIGCNEGFTTQYLAQAFPSRIIYGVDSPVLSGIHPAQRIEVPRTVGARARHLPNVRVVDGDFALLNLSILQDIGFVFIDGDHTYAGVKRDTEKVLRLMEGRSGGIIAWHDYASAEEEPNHPEWLRVGRYLRAELADKMDIYRVHRTTVAYTILP